MRELLANVLPDRVFIGRHMINNVRIRARKRKRELERLNIVIHPKYFDTSFIASYKDTSDHTKYISIIINIPSMSNYI